MRNVRPSSRGPRLRDLRRPGGDRAQVGSVLADLLVAPRFEVLPTAGTSDLVAAHLPLGRTVTVTASPARGLEATLATSVQLAERGYDVVPHLAARMVIDAAQLAEIVARLREAGVRRVFVPSGDADRAGEFADALGLLEALAELAPGFASIGITAYPEPYASVPDDVRLAAMWAKRPFATEAVSNLSFDATGVASWLGGLRRVGYPLPLWLGVPGPVDAAKLLTVATRIGVGESTRFLLKNRRTVTRLLMPGGFSTETFLRRLGPALAREDAGVAGLHLFTFNQVAETEAWRVALLTRLRDRAPGVRPTRRSRPPTTTSTPPTTPLRPHPDPGAPR